MVFISEIAKVDFLWTFQLRSAAKLFKKSVCGLLTVIFCVCWQHRVTAQKNIRAKFDFSVDFFPILYYYINNCILYNIFCKGMIENEKDYFCSDSTHHKSEERRVGKEC